MATPANHTISENELRLLLETVRRHGAQIAELEGRHPERQPVGSTDLHPSAQLDPEKYIRVEAYDALLRKYHELSAQNHELSQRCQQSQERSDSHSLKYNELKAKYRKAHEIAKQWKHWYDCQKVRQQGDDYSGTPDLRKEVPVVSEVRPSSASEERGVFNLPSKIIHARHTFTSPSLQPASSHPQPQQPSDASSTPKASTGQGLSSELRRHPSSQSTEVPSSPPRTACHKHAYSSDDEPTVVSARMVRPNKRVKPNPVEHVKIKQEPNSQDQPIELHSGDFSSPHAKIPCMAPEISDLDSGTTTEQLRRRRHDKLLRIRSRSEGYEPPPRSNSMPDHSSRSQINYDTVLIHEDLRPAQTIRTSVAPVAGVLQSISGNTSPASRLVKSSNNHRKSYGSFSGKIAELSEGGDELQRSPKGGKGSPKKRLSAEVKQRLDSLLDAPSPISQHDLAAKLNSPRANPRNVSRSATGTPTNGRNARNNVPISLENGVRNNTRTAPIPPEKECDMRDLTAQQDHAPGSINHRNITPSLHRPALPPPLPAPPRRVQIEPPPHPLRSRNLGDLRLNDFKINPKYQDSDFAFADTLRGREARRCLPGCTKPDCCGGAFRKALELAGGTGPSDLSDAHVLEAYLGPTWELTMGGYGPEKRNEVLADARTAAFAGEFGKHKTAFARHSTPPGFWTASFPDTQEAAEYRALASQMERDKVEERHREAVRPNGRWVFRDES